MHVTKKMLAKAKKTREAKTQLQDFDLLNFSVGTKVRFKGNVYEIIAVDFRDEEIGIENPFNGDLEFVSYEDTEGVLIQF